LNFKAIAQAAVYPMGDTLRLVMLVLKVRRQKQRMQLAVEQGVTIPS